MTNTLNVNRSSNGTVLSDNEPPVIDSGCPAGQTIVESNDPGKSYSSAFTFTTPSATDNSGEVPLVTCNSPSPYSNFPIGETSVTCEAVDSSGNNEICSFVVFVGGKIGK